MRWRYPAAITIFLRSPTGWRAHSWWYLLAGLKHSCSRACCWMRSGESSLLLFAESVCIIHRALRRSNSILDFFHRNKCGLYFRFLPKHWSLFFVWNETKSPFNQNRTRKRAILRGMIYTGNGTLWGTNPIHKFWPVMGNTWKHAHDLRSSRKWKESNEKGIFLSSFEVLRKPKRTKQIKSLWEPRELGWNR